MRTCKADRIYVALSAKLLGASACWGPTNQCVLRLASTVLPCARCTCADRYPADRMRAFASRLHAAGQQWVPIVNPGIGIQPGYSAYERGKQAGIWIRDHRGRPYIGQVWPGALLIVYTAVSP